MSKNDVVVDPILVTDDNTTSSQKTINVSQCGSNAYFYQNYTTVFVVTEADDCLLTVFLEETIQLTTHFAMTSSDFFSNNKSTHFIDRLCALLEIKDTSRVKIVGVYSGSLVVVTNIFPAQNATSGSMKDVQDSLSTKISSGAFSSTMAAAGMGEVLSSSSSYYTISNS